MDHDARRIKFQQETKTKLFSILILFAYIINSLVIDLDFNIIFSFFLSLLSVCTIYILK